MSNDKEQGFLDDYSSNKKLNEAVIQQMGGFEAFSENAQDISNHGIDGGFSGFIYHNDTISFAQNNRDVILESLKSDAQDFGSESVPEMMSHWRSLEGFSQDEIAEALYSNDESLDAHTSVYNALAWYAGEKASNEYTNAIDELESQYSEEKVVDTIQEIIDSNHPLTDDQIIVLKNIDEFANEKGLEVSQVEYNNDVTNGRSGDYVEVTLTNYKLDESGSFKDDVVIHLDSKIVEIDTGDNSQTFSYDELKHDFQSMKNELNEAMRDEYTVSVLHNDNQLTKVSIYEMESQVDFLLTGDVQEKAIDVNGERVAWKSGDNVVVDFSGEKDSLKQNLANLVESKSSESGLNIVSLSEISDFSSKIDNLQTGKDKENVKQIDNDLEM